MSNYILSNDGELALNTTALPSGQTRLEVYEVFYVPAYNKSGVLEDQKQLDLLYTVQTHSELSEAELSVFKESGKIDR